MKQLCCAFKFGTQLPEGDFSLCCPNQYRPISSGGSVIDQLVGGCMTVMAYSWLGSAALAPCRLTNPPYSP